MTLPVLFQCVACDRSMQMADRFCPHCGEPRLLTREESLAVRESQRRMEAEKVIREAAVPLWNPVAAVLWSLLLTPTFGAVIHGFNWRRLGRPLDAAWSFRWAACTAALWVAFPIVGAVSELPGGHGRWTRFAMLIVLAAWYAVAARQQIAEVRRRFNGAYERRGWLKPFGYVLLALPIYGLTLIAVAKVLDFALGLG